MKSIHYADVYIERVSVGGGTEKNEMSENTRDNISGEDCKPNTLQEIFQTVKGAVRDTFVRLQVISVYRCLIFRVRYFKKLHGAVQQTMNDLK